MSETKTFENLFLSSSIEENLEIDTIKLLVCSNVNSNFRYLMKLKEWQLESQEYFDYIIILGNFLELRDNKGKEEEEINANGESEISGLINYFENIALNIFYVGGDNDSKTLFKEPFPTLTLKSVNLHQNYYKLANDLYLVGYGSSFFKDKVNSIETTFSNYNKYIKEQNTTPNIQTILMTSNGIYNINKLGNVSNFRIKKEALEKNKLFCSTIMNKENNIIINLNGESILKKGNEVVSNTIIINPGQLCNGEFAIVILKREIKSKLWKIEKLDFITL